MHILQINSVSLSDDFVSVRRAGHRNVKCPEEVCFYDAYAAAVTFVGKLYSGFIMFFVVFICRKANLDDRLSI